MGAKPEISGAREDLFRYASANPENIKACGDFSRYASPNPENKWNIIVRVMEDIKKLLVQEIEEINTPNKGATTKSGPPQHQKLGFNGIRKNLQFF